MSSAIEGLEPQLLWKHFAALSRIPRGSKNEAAAAQFVLDTARQLGLEARQDAVGNVLVEKPASAGKERAPSVCLQSHLDMVCEKNADKVHDFTQGPDRAGARGQRAAGQRHDPRCGQRHRRRGGARRGRGSLARARAARDALHDRRGDRPHRGAAPRARLRPQPHPAQPGLGGRGRDLRGLLRRPGHPGRLEGRARGREAEHGRAGARASRACAAATRAWRSTRAGATRSRSSNRVLLALGRGRRRPAGGDPRREQAQRDPARGLRDLLRPEVAPAARPASSSRAGKRSCARSWARSSRTSR